MAGRQSGETRMMIDSVVWAQYINVTDTQDSYDTKALHRLAKMKTKISQIPSSEICV